MEEDQENQEEEQELSDSDEKNEEEDDLKTYLEEMKSLESDFSDMEELDMEELKAMQDAIAIVKESEGVSGHALISEEIQENKIEIEDEKSLKADEEYLAYKETMITDFSDLDGIDFDELKEMQEAMETVKKEEAQITSEDEFSSQPTGEISSELEERIKQELLERKEEKKKKIVSPEKFLEYTKNKRDKIWYHALHYLIYQAEDHVASKEMLYEMLKEVTSKSPIDPIPEHQFYFGLGYILRLTLNEKQIVRFISRGKFKINVAIKGLKDILDEVGEPISTRPILKEEEKQKMYKNFLKDDFLDI